MKTQNTHTPGPWRIETNDDWDGATVYDSTGRIVSTCDGCDIPGCSGEVSTNEAKANARLIAASPTLLTACQGALALLTNPNAEPSDADAVTAMLRTAITKAKGGNK